MKPVDTSIFKAELSVMKPVDTSIFKAEVSVMNPYDPDSGIVQGNSLFSVTGLENYACAVRRPCTSGSPFGG